MNTEQGGTDKRPPYWAEALLQDLVRARDRDDIAGDLLEEYRDSIVPAYGRRADRWYVRQVAWYLLHQVAVPAALVAATLLVRYLFDTLAPVQYIPGVIHPRSSIMSWALMLIFALTAARAVWRTGRVRSGVIVAFGSALAGGIGSVAGTAGMLAIWHDPATLHAWQASGGLDEAFWGVPLLLVPISVVTGTAGAVVSRLLALPFSLK
jgi:hypothetical protein